MAIDINYHATGSVICINTEHDNLTELEIIENFFFKILCDIFLNKPIILITKQPQEYSFAQGMSNSYNLKIDKLSVLTSKIDKCDTTILKSISQAEEFKRGLLFLVESNENLSKEEVSMILKATNDKESNVEFPPFTLIYSEDDGDGLYLCNTKLDIEYLQTLIKSTANQ